MYQNNRININSEKDIYDIYYSKDEPVLSKGFEPVKGADSHNSVIICDFDFFMCISWYNNREAAILLDRERKEICVEF